MTYTIISSIDSPGDRGDNVDWVQIDAVIHELVQSSEFSLLPKLLMHTPQSGTEGWFVLFSRLCQLRGDSGKYQTVFRKDHFEAST